MSTFHISTDKSRLDVDMIAAFLSERSYWAKGRTRDKIEKTIANCLCFGLYTDEGQQVGFARVVTDYAVFGWIMDVFILEDFRGQGLGKLLMAAIMNHPDLQGLERLGLGTKDAHGLYEQFGFTVMKHPERKMERTNLPTEF